MEIDWRLRAGALALGWLLAAAVANANVPEAEIDRAWDARGESMRNGFATPERIVAAIEGYRTLRQEQPGDVALRWKLLRALHFAVDFTDLDEGTKASYVAEAVALCDSGRGLLDDGEIEPAARARLSFWHAIARGMQAQRVGLLRLVREGTASKMFENARRALDLDPMVDRGGSLRLLSRLHATLPRVPFVSSWVDRARALPLAERAYELDPAHPGNGLVLALALLEREPEREEDARRLLERIREAAPRERYRAEDAAIQREAIARLEALEP